MDALRQPRLVEADPDYASRPVEGVMFELQEDDRSLLIAGPDPCPLLDPENLCSIYPTRPIACVALQAGEEQCQTARHIAGLPPLQPFPQRPKRSS